MQIKLPCGIIQARAAGVNDEMATDAVLPRILRGFAVVAAFRQNHWLL
jgi:hypothetical protein